MTIPARHSIVDVLALQGPSLDDALHRPHHVEPGGGTRGREQEDAVLSTPLHEVAAAMTRQVIPDEQHPHQRKKAIQLG